MYIFDKLYNCGIFQGGNKHKHYFEGWYFKHVDSSEKNVIAIIPGVSYEDTRDRSHAFIQIIEGSTYKTHYVRYGIDEFKYSKRSFELQISKNVFSAEGISLDIDREEISIHGSLTYSERIPWHSSLISPNSMGWYGFIPVMECYHGVLSLSHNISGCIKINDAEMNFDGGLGYMEKDWGTSFPSSWIWLQSNHFDIEDTAFMLSVAKIPWHSKSFTGFIVGVWNNEKLYRFATYTGAKLDMLEYSSTTVEIKLTDRDYQLIVKARQGSTGSLHAPIKGAMIGKVQESVDANLNILLVDKKSGRQILNTNARCCGMEVSGNIQEMVSLP